MALKVTLLGILAGAMSALLFTFRSELIWYGFVLPGFIFAILVTLGMHKEGKTAFILFSSLLFIAIALVGVLFVGLNFSDSSQASSNMTSAAAAVIIIGSFLGALIEMSLVDKYLYPTTQKQIAISVICSTLVAIVGVWLEQPIGFYLIIFCWQTVMGCSIGSGTSRIASTA